VPTHVRITEGAGQGRNRTGDEFSAAGPGGLAAKGPSGQDQKILGAVVTGAGVCGVKDVLEAVSPASDKFLPHGGRHFLHPEALLAEIDPQDMVRVSSLGG
jgi:hypothetical protein